MTTRDTIDPMIIFGPGRCIECGGQLTVIDMETCFMKLSPSGSPITEDTMIKCEAVCMHCSKRFPMIRIGSNYVPDNDYIRFLKQYNDMVHDKETNERMESLKPTKENPFCINIRETD